MWWARFHHKAAVTVPVHFVRVDCLVDLQVGLAGSLQVTHEGPPGGNSRALPAARALVLGRLSLLYHPAVGIAVEIASEALLWSTFSVCHGGLDRKR